MYADHVNNNGKTNGLAAVDDRGQGPRQLDLTKEEDMQTLRRLYTRYPGCWNGVPNSIKSECMRQIELAFTEVDQMAATQLGEENGEKKSADPMVLGSVIDRRMNIVKTAAVIVNAEQKDQHKLMDAVLGTGKGGNTTNTQVNVQADSVTLNVPAPRVIGNSD